MIADLHIHTTDSDGAFSLSETIEKARIAGVKIIAITNHDTVDGIKSLPSDSDIIKGIEITSRTEVYNGYKASLHILGYGISPEKIGPYTNALWNKRNILVGNFVSDCNSMHLPITRDDIVPPRGSKIQYASLVNAVSRISEGVITNQQALILEKYGIFWDRCNYSVREAIDIIHQAGGVAVWAHPYITYIKTSKQIYNENFINFAFPQIVKNGIDGVEAYYMSFSEKQQNFLAEKAKEYSLLTSAGSDYHGYPGRDKFSDFDSSLVEDLLDKI